MTHFSIGYRTSHYHICSRRQARGLLHIPKEARGLVLFVHGSGSSPFSVRKQYVARILNEAKLATLLFDLFTPEEDAIDSQPVNCV